MSNQTFASRVNALKQTGDKDKLQAFYSKLADRLIKLPNLSYILGYQVDEDDSEFGMCPCGHGLIIVKLDDNIFNEYRAHPQMIIACSNCKHHYRASFIKAGPSGHVSSPDLVVSCQSVDAAWPDYRPLVYPRFMWKLIAANGFY